MIVLSGCPTAFLICYFVYFPECRRRSFVTHDLSVTGKNRLCRSRGGFRPVEKGTMSQHWCLPHVSLSSVKGRKDVESHRFTDKEWIPYTHLQSTKEGPVPYFFRLRRRGPRENKEEGLLPRVGIVFINLVR